MENPKEPVFTDTEADLPKVDELTALKSRADLMGLTYHPAIGVEKLREKIAAAIAGEPTKDAVETTKQDTPVAAAPAPVVMPAPPVVLKQIESPTIVVQRGLSPKQHADYITTDIPNETPTQRKMRLKKHASELIRINVTCMNPNKKEWEGEIIGAGNNTVGSLTKFIPFGKDWHVPRIIYNVIRDRMCQVFVTNTDSKGNKVRQGKLIKEFAIDVLDPLTSEELHDLAERQAISRSID